LIRQVFLGRLAYPVFKREGFDVIGSGQTERAITGILAEAHAREVLLWGQEARMRVSGAPRSEGGAVAKSFARGLWAVRRRVVEFDQVRLTAFLGLA
jgi:hypothetical protein